MNKGWISLHRKILDNPILSRGRSYSRFEAFVFMLLSANHKPNKVVIGNQLIKVKTGSFITSQKKLMLTFNWSSAKLRGFLKLLETDSMIKVETNSISTQITIINYLELQGLRNADKTHTKRKKNTNKTGAETNNNDNKINNVDKEQKFINLVLAEGIKFTPMVSPEVIDDFCNYWTERNMGGTKMKYEMQKTFDIKRRLERWVRNQQEWKPATKYKNEEFKLDATGYNRIGYCDKCNESDFYKFPAKEDSRCCGAKLLTQRKIEKV